MTEYKCNHPNCHQHLDRIEFSYSKIPPPPRSTLFPYTTLFRSTVKSLVIATHYHHLSPSLCVVNKRRQSLVRSEEHTSELQSRENLVCRLLLEKKKSNLNQQLMSTIIYYFPTKLTATPTQLHYC